MNIYLVAYGDEFGTDRGVHWLTLAQGKLVKKAFYPISAKPGAMWSNQTTVWLSFIETKGQGIREYQRLADGELVFVADHSTEFFYTHFSDAHQPEYVLGCSFYHAVDALIPLAQPTDVGSVHHHSFRSRGDDPRQQGCHAHYIGITPEGKFAYSADLGSDEVLVYQLNDANLIPCPELTLDRPLASGPRLMPFHPNRHSAYLLNEINNSITVFSYQHGKFFEQQTLSTLSPEFRASNQESSAAGFKLTQDGKYLIVSNRGENSLVCFAVDAENGHLSECSRIPCGAIPRDLGLFAEYVIVAAQQENLIQLFHLSCNGILTATEQTIPCSSPVGIF